MSTIACLSPSLLAREMASSPSYRAAWQGRCSACRRRRAMRESALLRHIRRGQAAGALVVASTGVVFCALN